MIFHAPSTLAGWTAYFRDAEIPVLQETVEAIDALRPDEDRVDAQTLAGIVLGDPLMTLRVLAFMSRNRSSRMVTDAETVTSALLLIGVPPFFRKFADMTTVEAQLADLPSALEGVYRVLRRSHRAAQFALGFAIHRMDTDAEVIHEAALLNEFAEVLLWCHAPALMLEIHRRQLADSTLRSSDVQKEILNIEVSDLEQALMQVWRLPELLVTITDRRRFDHPKVRNVVLATALARHSQEGWTNAALPDDFDAIARLLNVSPEFARRKAMELNPV
jgi:HD-like signal output (HDOD) protein